MDNVLIHRSCQTREVQEGRRFEIIAGDHGFLASFELVLWTDPERYSDLLHYRKLVHMIDWSISRIISDRTLDPKRLLQLLRWRKQRRKFEPIFFFQWPQIPVLCIASPSFHVFPHITKLVAGGDRASSALPDAIDCAHGLKQCRIVN